MVPTRHWACDSRLLFSFQFTHSLVTDRFWHAVKNLKQELITHLMVTQEQWVRLAPAFIPEDLVGGVPTHERARFTEFSKYVALPRSTINPLRFLSM